MKFARGILILFVVNIILSSCSSQISTQNPQSQSSVVIYIKDGSQKKGIVLKKDGDNLLYIDAVSHNKESVAYENIVKVTKADVVYDFEANPIPRSTISEKQGVSNTLLYGGGGLILGAAAGVGVGIGLVGAGVELHPGFSIVAFGIAGAWLFGSVGAKNDYEDAVFEIRQQRYKVSKAKRENEIANEKQKIEEQKKEKKALLKKLEKKKSE